MFPFLTDRGIAFSSESVPPDSPRDPEDTTAWEEAVKDLEQEKS
ncbi:MAG TPA: hypothetical protein VJB58_00080 [Candidatus Paceibacterota bacterium]